jgi:hypothetical protein
MLDVMNSANGGEREPNALFLLVLLRFGVKSLYHRGVIRKGVKECQPCKSPRRQE